MGFVGVDCRDRVRRWSRSVIFFWWTHSSTTCTLKQIALLEQFACLEHFALVGLSSSAVWRERVVVATAASCTALVFACPKGYRHHSTRMEIELMCRASPKAAQYNNRAVLSPATFNEMKSACEGSDAVRCIIRGFIFNVESNPEIGDNEIGLARIQRHTLAVPEPDRGAAKLKVAAWQMPHPPAVAASVQIEMSTFVTGQSITLKDEDVEPVFRKTVGGQVISVNQQLALVHNQVVVKYRIKKISLFDVGKGKASQDAKAAPFGVLQENTELLFSASDNGSVNFMSNKTRKIFSTEFNFQQLGIGGLDAEFADIFRRAFVSRTLPAHVISEMGVKPVKGMLLHGPPGTGKTLIARQIGKALDAREPKVVNGPEVLNKFVGQSEENIRALFKEAEEEQKKKGENSSLHIIIFDEIDAICKQRGTVTGGAGVNDSVVNQLLSKIDGVDSLQNILLIGMTNRRDLIDEALLRPGRLEVHVEIGLPDEEGRMQIFGIHTSKIRNAGRLETDVDLRDLSVRTKNYSGAEIEGLVRSAASFAFSRAINPKDLAHPSDTDAIKIRKEDFEAALDEVKSAFGVDEDMLTSRLTGGIIPYSVEFKSLVKDLFARGRQVRDASSTTNYSVLLQGPPASGKTALACMLATRSGFPYCKFTSPESYVGFSEIARVSALSKLFDDAYKSVLSMVVLDNLEGLLDYSPIGPRFSNVVLQALKALVRRPPKKAGRRLLIVGTTSERHFLEQCGLAQDFRCRLTVPLVSGAEVKHVITERCDASQFPPMEVAHVCRRITFPIGIRDLLEVLETAAAVCSPDAINADAFMECLAAAGHHDMVFA
eukprot:Polyplicarium_translucidae@DN3379_c3_g1_i11.p1